MFTNSSNSLHNFILDLEQRDYKARVKPGNPPGFLATQLQMLHLLRLNLRSSISGVCPSLFLSPGVTGKPSRLSVNHELLQTERVPVLSTSHERAEKGQYIRKKQYNELKNNTSLLSHDRTLNM